MGKATVKKRKCVNTFMLRARLVDRHGRLLRPTAVETIDFIAISIDEKTCEACPLGFCALDPSEVILDELQNDEGWDVDVCGYNFRHLIDAGEFKFASLPRHGEFRYIIRDTSSNVSIVRFQISGTKYDRN
jgi:hypothetical protein